MKILVIDNNIDRLHWGAPELRQLAASFPGATVWVRRAPQEDLPVNPRDFDRIIISGSNTSAMDSAPWVMKLHDFVRKALAEKSPMLGICYGHQVLARVLGGKELMRQAFHPELGWTEMELVGESRILKGLPKVFFSFSSHFQEVLSLPPGARHTLRSERCQVQGFELDSAPVFGLQFHPERNLKYAELSLRCHSKDGHSKILLRPNEGLKLYDPQVAQIIFKNFLSDQI